MRTRHNGNNDSTKVHAGIIVCTSCTTCDTQCVHSAAGLNSPPAAGAAKRRSNVLPAVSRCSIIVGYAQGIRKLAIVKTPVITSTFHTNSAHEVQTRLNKGMYNPPQDPSCTLQRTKQRTNSDSRHPNSHSLTTHGATHHDENGVTSSSAARRPQCRSPTLTRGCSLLGQVYPGTRR